DDFPYAAFRQALVLFRGLHQPDPRLHPIDDPLHCRGRFGREENGARAEVDGRVEARVATDRVFNFGRAARAIEAFQDVLFRASGGHGPSPYRSSSKCSWAMRIRPTT